MLMDKEGVYIHNKMLIRHWKLWNEILPFGPTWMDLEGIKIIEIPRSCTLVALQADYLLSEPPEKPHLKCQTKTNTVWFHLYV